MCQDGEASISRFNGDLCSSWKPCESMTARQIKPPYPRWLRHLNWQWLGWLCPNHQLCCSSSEASSWTEEMQTIDTLHIFQWWTCHCSPWLQTLLSYTSCWCHWTSQQRGVNKDHRSQYISKIYIQPSFQAFTTPKRFLPSINDFNIWRLWVVSHFSAMCVLPNSPSFCKEGRRVQMLRRLARVSLALGPLAAERLTTADTRLNRCYFFQKSLIQATVYLLFRKVPGWKSASCY